MTTFSDETLMAFADEELDPAARAAVDAAMREDPAIQKRVERYRALRSRIRLAYSAELNEAPPDRLLAAARGVRAKSAQISAPEVRPHVVSDLARARAARRAHDTRLPAVGLRWPVIASMAAGLLIGVALGYGILHQSSSIVTRNGQLVASGALANSLSNQLGSDRSDAALVQVGLSFRSKSGDYCRVFSMSGANAPAGMACRHAADWEIEVLARSDGTSSGDGAPANLRTAGSDLSPSILDMVQRRINGDPLDRAGEVSARQRSWQP